MDERLRCAAQMVREGSRVADIGTDHAYLPVWLVENGRCPSAIAGDIAEGPVAAACATVEKAGLRDKVVVRLGDGLSVLAPNEAQDIVIAGMGGETIAAIMEAAVWLRDGADRRLILQPMTKAERLRAYLLQNGFVIEEERLVRDGRHLYPVLRVRFADAPPSEDPLAAYVGALSDREGAAYFRAEAAHLRRRALGLYLTAPESEEAATFMTWAKALIARAERGEKE